MPSSILLVSFGIVCYVCISDLVWSHFVLNLPWCKVLVPSSLKPPALVLPPLPPAPPLCTHSPSQTLISSHSDPCISYKVHECAYWENSGLSRPSVDFIPSLFDRVNPNKTCLIGGSKPYERSGIALAQCEDRVIGQQL